MDLEHRGLEVSAAGEDPEARMDRLPLLEMEGQEGPMEEVVVEPMTKAVPLVVPVVPVP